MCKKEEVYYIVVRRKLLQRSYPSSVIELAELKHTLGEVFRIPKDLLFQHIKELVEHRIIEPTTDNRWMFFKVIN